ncbi:MAG: hypothetical protein RL839_14425 [Gammaproteobacteria bacterium]
MKLETRQIVELISVIAVVASLLFVGMQLMLDRQVAIGEQYHNRSESSLETARIQFSNEAYIDQLVRRFKRGHRPAAWNPEVEAAWSGRFSEEGDLAIADFYRDLIDARIISHQLDNIHRQYELGLMDEEYWQGIRNLLKIHLADPTKKASFPVWVVRPSFNRLTDELLEEIASESGT